MLSYYLSLTFMYLKTLLKFLHSVCSYQNMNFQFMFLDLKLIIKFFLIFFILILLIINYIINSVCLIISIILLFNSFLHLILFHLIYKLQITHYKIDSFFQAKTPVIIFIKYILNCNLIIILNHFFD